MSPRETRRRRTIALIAATWIAIALLGGGVWHVSDLRQSTMSAAQRRLNTTAAGAARMVDAWTARLDADASGLAGLASLRGGHSLQDSSTAAGRELGVEMAAMRQRGQYDAVWIVDRTGRTLASLPARARSVREDSAVALALRTGKRAVSRPERQESGLAVAMVEPILAGAAPSAGIDGAIVIRTVLDRALISTGTVRPNAVAPVVVIPGPAALGLTLCPGPNAGICAMPVINQVARFAIAQPTGIAQVSVNGRPTLVATAHASSLPWSVYSAATVDDIFAPMRQRLRFEALTLIGLMLLMGVGAYAYERSAHLRRMTERSQSEARFSAIVNTAMDAIMIVDSSLELVMMNRAAERLFGYAWPEAAGLSLLSLVPETARDEFRRVLIEAIQAAETPGALVPQRYSAGRRRDGTTFPADLSVSRTHIDGRVHLTIVIRDVTTWRRAEEHSEWQRRVLEAIATGMELREVLSAIVRFHETQCPDVECAVHVIDDDGVTLRSASAPSMRPEFVEAMDEIIIGPRAATCGAAVWRRAEVVTTDISSDDLWNDYRALALEQGYRGCWSRPIVAPQGRLLGALTAYVREPRPPTTDELRITATAVQLAGIAVDRAYAAESLRQSEASFRSFVENSPIGIYRAGGTGRLVAVNESLVRLLGYRDAGELLQLDLTKDLFVAGPDRERLERQLKSYGEFRSAEIEWRRKDGSNVTVRVSARAYRDDRGVVWYSEGFVENVTPLRAAERALRQSEKLAALGQLVSGVAHELNNPLASILHFAEDLLEDERTAGDHEAISIIRDQARRSRSIVRDLLSFVRLRDASRELVPVRDALLATAKGLQPAVTECGARLELDLPGEPTLVHTDRAGLQQIVTNLVMNGAQAAGTGGVVSVQARVDGAALTVVVEDSGPGIAAEHVDRVFEPFFTTKPTGAGTGLGLSVTLGIVQQLGGQIDLVNRATARGGARFTVTLPIVVEHSPPVSVAAAPDPSAAAIPAHHPKPRVLVIDDEPTFRLALRRFFARRGWQVDEANDGVEGLSAVLDAQPGYDIVISDLNMPGCSGVELHDRIASLAPELLDRVIFSTGDIASQDAAGFVSRTRCTVLQKPFELRTLEGTIAKVRQMASV